MHFVIKIWINLFCHEEKGVYSYEYMDSCERLVEELLSNREVFYSSLNVEDIKDVDYRHAKRVYW